MLFTVGSDLGSTLSGIFYGVIGNFWAWLTNWMFLGLVPNGYAGKSLSLLHIYYIHTTHI